MRRKPGNATVLIVDATQMATTEIPPTVTALNRGRERWRRLATTGVCAQYANRHGLGANLDERSRTKPDEQGDRRRHHGRGEQIRTWGTKASVSG